MTITIREEGSVPLPEELAREYGLHEGSVVEWERTPDGAPTPRPAPPRLEAIDRLGEVLKPYLRGQGGGVEAFLEWRREDARLDGSL